MVGTKTKVFVTSHNLFALEWEMELRNNEVILNGPGGKIIIKRNRYGIPEIQAETPSSAAFALGWVHANDRQMQTLLTRVILRGRAAEKLSGDSALIEIDRYMRRMNFLPDAAKEIKKLESGVKEQLQAYAGGFNNYMSRHKPVFELKLLGYTPEPWSIEDSLLIGKVFGFLGLADAQGNMEKLIVQLVQNGIDEKKLKELFPRITEKINVELLKKVSLAPPLVPEAVKWLMKLPRFSASNNWVVSGALTQSGQPILCNDPHLEVNRLPAVWQEIVMRLPGNTLQGVSIPGVPGVILGRSNNLAWGATYSFMDMIDFRIEHCQGGAFRRGKDWKPFKVREETINVKNGDPVIERVYENEHGLLEGDPSVEGHYLVMCWSGARDCGAGEFNSLLSMPGLKTTREAMDNIRRLDAASFNWVIADTAGTIGYQMSGRLFKRPKGVSGLLPLPAWEKKFDNAGFVNKSQLPSLYDPKDGFIVTANQDLNHLGKTQVINLPMAPYRANRITQLLKRKKKFTVEYMKQMHFDLYSIQAQRFMKYLKPLLPETDNGRILKDWNLTYTADSKGAMLFESVYLAMLRVVFGDQGMGRDVVNHLMLETGLFNDYYGNFDDILMKKKSAWFMDKTQDEIFKAALDEGLRVKAVPYGFTREITLANLLFGGKLPGFLGFDYGPIMLPGNRATIPQGQIFKSAGRVTTFSPSYRMIADMSCGELHTNLAGGSTDRRFSRWYVNDLRNWMKGIYKVLK